MFPLCKAFAVNTLSKCEHSNEERSFIGTWTHIELQKAIEKGYEIVKIYEAHHFEHTSDKLFKGYMDYFVGMKQKSAKNNNPGLKSVAKLFCNSLWGKFGQMQNMSQNVFVNTKSEFFNKLLSDKYEKITFNIHNENLCEFSFIMKDEYSGDNSNNNPYICASTTSYARLKLYEALNMLSEKVLYYDTDSVICNVNKNEQGLQTSKESGCWEREDPCVESEIHEFISSGPKSYEFKCYDSNRDVLKIKGFTLNHECSKILKYRVLETLIDKMVINKDDDSEISTPYTTFVRNKKEKNIKIENRDKRFTVTFDKRVILAWRSPSNCGAPPLHILRNEDNNINIDTVPDGY